MRPLKRLITLEEALSIVLASCRPVADTETLPLALAAGRVLAVDVVAGISVPPFARSAMDGYAVRAADTVGAGRYEPVSVAVGETVFAGRVPTEEVAAGRCARIATGAPVPPGADAVVKVEDTEESGGRVRIRRPVYPGENVAPVGEDIRPGDRLMGPGTVLTPARIGVAAALGLAEIEVLRRPRALLYTTGDEIQAPGLPLSPGKVYDINSFTLGALLETAGVAWEKGACVADTEAAIGEAMEAGRAFDLILFSGGSSAGDRDLLVDVLASKGSVRFHGIALKPGKPTLFGDVGGVPCFGVPGFPASCLAVGHLLVLPGARTIAGRPPIERRSVRASLGAAIHSSVGRFQIFTVRLEEGRAFPVYKESGDITSLSAADGYVEIPSTVEILGADEEVEVVLF